MRMRYQDAFNDVVKRYGLDYLNETFLVHSLLSDLIGSSLDDIGLVNAYYSLNKQLPLYSFIQNKTLAESKTYIKSLIAKSNNEYTVVQFIRSVEPLLLILFPKEYVPIAAFQAKAQSQKIDVVRNNRQVQNEHAKVLIQKAIVNAKATPQKKPKAQKLKKYITQPCLYATINAACSTLSVTYNTGDDIKIIDSFNHDVTNSAVITQTASMVTVDISNKHHEYTIMLPKKRYNRVEVNYEGSVLTVSGIGDQLFSATNLAVNTNKALTRLYVKSSSLECSQNKGDAYILGDITNIYMGINKGDVDCYITGKRGNYYVINSNSGDINLEFEEDKVRPKINHFFQPVDSVKGRYYIGSRSIKLELTTNKGRIRVR